MIKPFTNPCSRCGQERVLIKRWVEEVPTFTNKTIKVTRSTNACPDEECQKIIDKEIAVQKQKRDKIKADREEKIQQNQKERDLDAELKKLL